MENARFYHMKRNAGRASSLLKALANEKRLLILCGLADGELSVGELNQQIDISQSALSQHLAALRKEKLVKTRREAQTIYYSLADPNLPTIMSALDEIYAEQSKGVPTYSNLTKVYQNE